MLELHVETTAQLHELCTHLKESEWLALDTEFVREKTYYPNFCLLQICNGKVAASVDPLAIGDMSELLDLIYDHSRIKVFHAGRQDLEIFHQLWGKLPQPIFDTQLAANLLGLGDQIGYANLVEKLTGRKLEKGHSRTDWSRRPLSREQLRYALDDVIYLGEIYPDIRAQLRALKRETWLQEDFNFLTDPATYTMDPQTMWQRVKGSQRLQGVQLAVLQAISAWREQEAERVNRPRRWIIKDELLVELASRQPTNPEELDQIRNLDPGSSKHYGDQLLKLIAAAKELPKHKWPQAKAHPIRLSAEQKASINRMQSRLQQIADQEKITLSTLASRKELELLATGDMDSELLHGWRKVLVGDILIELLEGHDEPEDAKEKHWLA